MKSWRTSLVALYVLTQSTSVYVSHCLLNATRPTPSEEISAARMAREAKVETAVKEAMVLVSEQSSVGGDARVRPSNIVPKNCTYPLMACSRDRRKLIQS